RRRDEQTEKPQTAPSRLPLDSPPSWVGAMNALFAKGDGKGAFGSTGQRNTLVEYFCWGTEGQRLARPLVQLTSGPVQVGLRARREVCAFREVLAEETIRVLVRPPLPRALRIAEVDPHVGSDRELLVRRHLQPAIPGE